MAHKDGTKSGGRQVGSQTKASKELKAFLDRVFTKAFDEAYEVELAQRIRTFTIDSKLLVRLLEYWAGAPTKQHTVTGTVSLAQLIAGTAPDTEDEDAA